MSKEKIDEKVGMSFLSLDELFLKVMRMWVENASAEYFSNIDMEAYVDSRCRAVLEKMKHEH